MSTHIFPNIVLSTDNFQKIVSSQHVVLQDMLYFRLENVCIIYFL